MATNNAPKRSRASVQQLSRLVDFMFESPGLSCGQFLKLHGKFEFDRKWNEMTELLNSLGGAVKTVEQWHTVWRDLKSRTSIKVRERKKQGDLAGKKPINQEPITELERRVIAIIGSEFIEGQESVSENVPIKEELQLRLEDGDESVFFEMPSISNIPEESIDCRWDTLNTPVENTLRRGLKRKRVEHESDTQNKFLDIANKQADALNMLAESSASSVEVAKKQVDVLKMLADCSATNIEANKIMAEAIKTMGEGLKASADAINNLANAIKRV